MHNHLPSPFDAPVMRLPPKMRSPFDTPSISSQQHTPSLVDAVRSPFNAHSNVSSDVSNIHVLETMSFEQLEGKHLALQHKIVALRKECKRNYDSSRSLGSRSLGSGSGSGTSRGSGSGSGSGSGTRRGSGSGSSYSHLSHGSSACIELNWATKELGIVEKILSRKHWTEHVAPHLHNPRYETPIENRTVKKNARTLNNHNTHRPNLNSHTMHSQTSLVPHTSHVDLKPVDVPPYFKRVESYTGRKTHRSVYLDPTRGIMYGVTQRLNGVQLHGSHELATHDAQVAKRWVRTAP